MPEFPSSIPSPIHIPAPAGDALSFFQNPVNFFLPKIAQSIFTMFGGGKNAKIPLNQYGTGPYNDTRPLSDLYIPPPDYLVNPYGPDYAYNSIPSKAPSDYKLGRRGYQDNFRPNEPFGLEYTTNKERSSGLGAATQYLHEGDPFPRSTGRGINPLANFKFLPSSWAKQANFPSDLTVRTAFETYPHLYPELLAQKQAADLAAKQQAALQAASTPPPQLPLGPTPPPTPPPGPPPAKNFQPEDLLKQAPQPTAQPITPPVSSVSAEKAPTVMNIPGPTPSPVPAAQQAFNLLNLLAPLGAGLNLLNALKQKNQTPFPPSSPTAIPAPIAPPQPPAPAPIAPPPPMIPQANPEQQFKPINIPGPGPGPGPEPVPQPVQHQPQQANMLPSFNPFMNFGSSGPSISGPGTQPQNQGSGSPAAPGGPQFPRFPQQPQQQQPFNMMFPQIPQMPGGMGGSGGGSPQGTNLAQGIVGPINPGLSAMSTQMFGQGFGNQQSGGFGQGGGFNSFNPFQLTNLRF